MIYAVYSIETGEVFYHMETTVDVNKLNAALDSDLKAMVVERKIEEPSYVFNGVVTPRPTLPKPSASYDLTALPAGTVVTVIDESQTVYEITDLSETLTLEGPQTYRVKVDPSFPYQRIATTVEVA